MRYATAAAFRMALEERIRQRGAADGTAIWWIRRRVAIERFLSRLQAPPDSPWLLKGALALDLRFPHRARTTKDLDLGIDVSLLGGSRLDHAKIAQMLREAAVYPLPDFFIFTVPREGEEVFHEKGSRTYRFTVQAVLGGRLFEEFKVDVGTRPELVAPVEEVPESDTLAFTELLPGWNFFGIIGPGLSREVKGWRDGEERFPQSL